MLKFEKFVFLIFKSFDQAKSFVQMEVDVIAESEQDVLSSDNQPTPETLSKYRLAGHLCSVAIKAVIAKCLPGTSCTTLCQLGDDTILTQVLYLVCCNRVNYRRRKCINLMREELLNQRL